MQVCHNVLDNLKKEQKELEEKEELHKFQLKELTLYPISKEYEQKINKQHKLLSNAEKIKENLSVAVDMIDNGQHSILKVINQVKQKMNQICIRHFRNHTRTSSQLCHRTD